MVVWLAETGQISKKTPQAVQCIHQNKYKALKRLKMAKSRIIYTDDRHTKMREYHRNLLKRKKLIKQQGDGRKPLRDIPISFLSSVQPTRDNFIGTDPEEPVTCAKFGCGRHLSNTEKLASRFCIHHQSKQKIDPTVFVSHPFKKTG